MNTIIELKRGDMVQVSNPIGTDREFKGRTGAFIEYTAKGYARVYLYGDGNGHYSLIHPESLTFQHR